MASDSFLTNWSPLVPLIVDRTLLEKIEAGGPRALDAFLLPEVRLLKTIYGQTGNPAAVYTAAGGVAGVVMQFPASFYSFQFSQLQALMAEMLLVQGKTSSSLRKAMQHLDLAVETLYRIPILTDEVVRAHVYNGLLRSIANKALGELTLSVADIENTINYLTAKGVATDLDLIPLRRQEIMIRQSIKAHRELAEEAVHYMALRPKEYYRSLKRVFEFLLNKDRSDEAKQIVPEFKRAFASVAMYVTPISRVSFLKNIGQYLLVTGQPKEAGQILRRSFEEAASRNLHGQVRQIKLLLQELDAGGKQAKLVTFRAADFT